MHRPLKKGSGISSRDDDHGMRRSHWRVDDDEA